MYNSITIKMYPRGYIRSSNQYVPFKHLLNKNILACLHFDISLDLLFNKFLDLCCMMRTEEFFRGAQVA